MIAVCFTSRFDKTRWHFVAVAKNPKHAWSYQPKSESLLDGGRLEPELLGI